MHNKIHHIGRGKRDESFHPCIEGTTKGVPKPSNNEGSLPYRTKHNVVIKKSMGFSLPLVGGQYRSLGGCLKIDYIL